MSKKPSQPLALSAVAARKLWIRAQRLDSRAPFGAGSQATPAAIAHLGYVQIDTIHVIERCHHHILYTRIPQYRREHLHAAQSIEKSVFEYWTHALAYVPTADYRYFVRDMLRNWVKRNVWFSGVKEQEVRKVLRRIRTHGALTIRDISDDVLIEKDHEWASRKPSKRALQLAFYRGQVAIAARSGMLKSYELSNRHFGWMRPPHAASVQETHNYLLDRALRSQAVVSLDSVCYLNASLKPAVRRIIERRVRRGTLLPVTLEGAEPATHWVQQQSLDGPALARSELVHVLSPFDPLVNQRRRLQLFFGYDHRFEAYVPKAKRVFGYFVCPVLVGDQIVAALDLKTDRERGKLLIQRWNWICGRSSRVHKVVIEEELHRFEAFQLGR